MLTLETKAAFAAKAVRIVTDAGAQAKRAIEKKEALKEVQRQRRQEERRQHERNLKRFKIELDARIELAASGISVLLELAEIESIYQISSVSASHYIVSSDDEGLPLDEGGLPKGGFLYYLAQDDDDTLYVILYPDRVIIGWSESFAKERYTFERTTTPDEVRKTLSIFASHNGPSPLAILKILDQNGRIGGYLSKTAFEVLVESAEEFQVTRYFESAIAFYEYYET